MSLTDSPNMNAEEECGVEAFYAGGHGKPYYQPAIRCMCGGFYGRDRSWEEVGAAYDAHLSGVRS